MQAGKEIETEMLNLRDEQAAFHLMRFFKCQKGEYGYGDKFLGIRVPQTREIVKKYRKEISIEGIHILLESPWHEIRLAGFLSLIEIYKRAKGDKKREIIDYYLSKLDRGNNWDLVDVVAPKLLGDWLVNNPDEIYILDQLAEMEGRLWHQRVSMVTTWMLIRHDMTDPTLRLAEKFLNHKHDLMHKATGWMLREVGNRNYPALITFLESHAHEMPRTMLRYAIEKLDEETRQKYMKKK